MDSNLHAVVTRVDPVAILSIATAAALAVLTLCFILWAGRATRNVCRRFDVIDRRLAERESGGRL